MVGVVNASTHTDDRFAGMGFLGGACTRASLASRRLRGLRAPQVSLLPGHRVSTFRQLNVRRFVRRLLDPVLARGTSRTVMRDGGASRRVCGITHISSNPERSRAVPDQAQTRLDHPS
jgi:hypothetical protein